MITSRTTFWVCCFLSLPQFGPTALSEGYVIQWGWDTAAGVATPPSLVLSNAVAVAAGSGHSLALRRDGTVVGWGGNLVGNATGMPTTNAPYVAEGQVYVEGQVLSNVVSICAGPSFSLALKKDGTLATWGQNYVPLGLTNIAAIAAGWSSSWVLERGGTIIGWVSDSSLDGYAQLLPVEGLSNVAAIAVGLGGDNTRGLALLRDATVGHWGSESIYKDATPPTGLSNVIAVAAGASHSLALKSDGTIVGWGSNESGQATGVPTTEYSAGFSYYSAGVVQIGGQALSNVTSVAACRGYSMALKKDGTIVTWGRMGYNLYPVTVPKGLSNVVAIAAGDYFCLAITTNAAVAERFRR